MVRGRRGAGQHRCGSSGSGTAPAGRTGCSPAARLAGPRRADRPDHAGDRVQLALGYPRPRAVRRGQSCPCRTRLSSCRPPSDSAATWVAGRRHAVVGFARVGTSCRRRHPWRLAAGRRALAPGHPSRRPTVPRGSEPAAACGRRRALLARAAREVVGHGPDVVVEHLDAGALLQADDLPSCRGVVMVTTAPARRRAPYGRCGAGRPCGRWRRRSGRPGRRRRRGCRGRRHRWRRRPGPGRRRTGRLRSRTRWLRLPCRSTASTPWLVERLGEARWRPRGCG